MMAKPGPQRTPTQILKLRGSWLADTRPDKEGLPTKKVKMPGRVVKHKYAKAFWKKNYQFLFDLGLMSGWAFDGFENMAIVYHWYRSAEDELDEAGKAWTCLKETNMIYRQCRTDYVKLAKGFGCTPSAQSSIQLEITKPDAPSGKDKYFGKKFGNNRA